MKLPASLVIVSLCCVTLVAVATSSDFYERLAVDRDATKKQIKSAYRKMALRYHPDKNKDNSAVAEEKFMEITKAYEVLTDKDKRAIYDRYGEAGLEDQGMNRQYSSADMNDFFSNFDSMFKNTGDGSFFRTDFDSLFKDFDNVDDDETEDQQGGIFSSLFNRGGSTTVKKRGDAVYQESNMADILGDMSGLGGMKCKTIKIVKNGISSSKTICS